VEQGEKLISVELHSIGTFHFDMNLGRAAIGEILMLTRGASTG
jgi:hypothetical protein